MTLPATPNAEEGRAATKAGAQIACVTEASPSGPTCTAPREICCFGERSACAVALPFSEPKIPPGTSKEDAAEARNKAAMEHRGALADACEKSVGDYAGHASCDDSSDCSEGLRCCEQYIASGAPSYSECAASCDVSEVCRTDAQCSSPDAACIGGQCKRAPEKLACGKSFCSKDRPICCTSEGKQPICATDAQCMEEERMTRLECTSRRDCLEGYCQRNFMGSTYCTLLLDVANAGIVCEKDTDCDDAICVGSPGKGVCDGDDRVCQCAAE